jgi:predicted membrane GTPase involved in stress response
MEPLQQWLKFQGLHRVCVDSTSAGQSIKITKLEKEEILDWLAKDIQTKTLIDRKISIIITSKWSESQSAHQQWDILSQSQVCVQPE